MEQRNVVLTLSVPLVCALLGACPRESAIPVPVSGGETPHAEEETPAFFATLVEQARERASSAYSPTRALDPASPLASMRYDEHRRIRFRPEASIFRHEQSRFEAQLFHLGATSRTPVSLFILDPESSTPRALPYDRRAFVLDESELPDALVAPAYAGFRLHAPINTDAYKDEVIVFQGASYFRAVARHQAYGLSARGLAVDTGTTHAEEFPVFDTFYLVRPRRDDTHAWVLASLTSAHFEGAYAFRITPGATTTVDVHAHLFPRGNVEVVGLAPLTSMFLFGEEGPARFGDFRPEVHDSDALVMASGTGERLVRPLRNPQRTTVSTFTLPSPRGFGLVQRDRAFDHFQDLEARYHERPSVWVQPVGDWGEGAVRLLEIATELETDDNVAAMWVPAAVPQSGLVLAYRLSFGSGVENDGGARAESTRIARLGPSRARFLVDFVGASLERTQDVVSHVTVTGGSLVESHVEPNPATRGFRASFEVAAASPDVELRVFLASREGALGETWSYLWQPTP